MTSGLQKQQIVFHQVAFAPISAPASTVPVSSALLLNGRQGLLWVKEAAHMKSGEPQCSQQSLSIHEYPQTSGDEGAKGSPGRVPLGLMKLCVRQPLPRLMLLSSSPVK